MKKNLLRNILYVFVIFSLIFSACTPAQQENQQAWIDLFLTGDPQEMMETHPEYYETNGLAEIIEELLEYCDVKDVTSLIFTEDQMANLSTDQLTASNDKKIVMCEAAEDINTTSFAIVSMLALPAIAEPTAFGEIVVGAVYTGGKIAYVIVIASAIIVPTAMLADQMIISATEMQAIAATDLDEMFYFPHSGKNHNQTAPATQTAIAAFAAAWTLATTGPELDPDNWRCIATVMVDGTTQFALFLFSAVSPDGGYMYWWNTTTGRWGAYSKSATSINKIEGFANNGEALRPGKDGVSREFRSLSDCINGNPPFATP